MGKAGEKQKRRPKLKDKRQSERFKEAARELGADKSSDTFDRIVEQMAHVASSKSKILNSAEEVRDTKRDIDKSIKAIERSRRALKKQAD